jgi:hypothetical protein
VRNKTARVKGPAKRKTSTQKPQQQYYDLPPFHVSFPVTLDLKNDPEKKRCFFQCKEHMESYIKRHNLKKKDYIISETEKRDE